MLQLTIFDYLNPSSFPLPLFRSTYHVRDPEAAAHRHAFPANQLDLSRLSRLSSRPAFCPLPFTGHLLHSPVKTPLTTAFCAPGGCNRQFLACIISVRAGSSSALGDCDNSRTV